MEEKNFTSILRAFNYQFQTGKSDGINLIESYANAKNITQEELRLSVISKINDPSFDWVNIAFETNFVYTSDQLPPEELKVDDLLIFTDSYRWKEAVKHDALLSPSEREELKDVFREIGVQYYNDVFELLEKDDFDWLPFEVKHAYWSNFHEMRYTNEDIIFHLKCLVWDYLFPNSTDQIRLSKLKVDLANYLEKVEENEGWTDGAMVVKVLSSDYPNLDLYELSLVEEDEIFERKRHFRNPFTFGFIRLKR